MSTKTTTFCTFTVRLELPTGSNAGEALAFLYAALDAANVQENYTPSKPTIKIYHKETHYA